ncbi:hypothetical protein C2E23DRAFT_829762 [Lenzites betulinus]|nr:hypothetical protein C2E23DRAFT_829762 [Lenzites betulinus]
MGSLARPPDGLFGVVKNAIVERHHDKQADQAEHPSTPPLAQPPAENNSQFSSSGREDKRPWDDDGQKESSGDVSSSKPDVSAIPVLLPRS